MTTTTYTARRVYNAILNHRAGTNPLIFLDQHSRSSTCHWEQYASGVSVSLWDFRLYDGSIVSCRVESHDTYTTILIDVRDDHYRRLGNRVEALINEFQRGAVTREV